MRNPLHEYRVFLSYPRNMRVLLVTHLKVSMALLAASSVASRAEMQPAWQPV